MYASLRPAVTDPGIIELGAHSPSNVIEEVRVERRVQRLVRPPGDLADREVRRHRREADEGRALADHRTERIDKQRRVDQVDRKDAPPIRHRRRDAGGVGDTTKLSRGTYLRGESG